MKPKRLSSTSFALLADAAGSPRALANKMIRLVGAVSAYVDTRALDARLERLHDLGLIERVPTRVQLVFGAVDMLRFFIVPAAEDYYRSKGIDFRFHQVLRFLDDPASIVDPTGFLSARDVIIGHLMQVVHANPQYDLQLLESHEGGLDDLEAQVVAMIAGTHPRARSIGAIVEDDGYHARLLDYVRAYRRDRDSFAPVRDNVSARFVEAERTFGTLPSAMRYFASLPSDFPRAFARMIQTSHFAGA